MNPNIYELSKMTKEQYDFIMKRAELDITEQMKVAKEVSDDVKARGDEAVLEYTAKFDRVQLTADKMKVRYLPEFCRVFYSRRLGSG